jgi:hypothetical protein
VLRDSRNILRVAPQFQPVFREVGLDAEGVFTHDDIKPWRILADRENCTLDATLADGESIRWHIKRYPAVRFGLDTPADEEVDGYRALHDAGIPTAPLVGWGRLSDGRSFVITEDLHGYDAADKIIERAGGEMFDKLLEPTADLAARLHRAGLHHRDLYLCHFFASVDETDSAQPIDIRLIDIARVARLRNTLTRKRWIIKDLAQFWYSTLSLSITDKQRARWLSRYGEQRGIDAPRFRTLIERKSAWIARHDRILREREPDRNISIPS